MKWQHDTTKSLNRFQLLSGSSLLLKETPVSKNYSGTFFFIFVMQMLTTERWTPDQSQTVRELNETIRNYRWF